MILKDNTTIPPLRIEKETLLLKLKSFPLCVCFNLGENRYE